MFSLKKVDDLRVREREQEERGTINSTPKWAKIETLKALLQLAE